MECRHRLDDFAGTDEEYVRYLESSLMQSRQAIFQGDRSNYSLQRHYVRPGQQRWKKELNAFLLRIPVSSNWLKKREDLGMASVEKNCLAIEMLLGCSPVHRSYDMKGSLVERAEAYAQCTKSFQQDLRFNSQLARFQEFVFISWCVVMIDSGYSKATVESIMQICISNCTRKNLQRLRLGVIWANRGIARLSKSAWDFRSTEVFVLCM